MKSLKLGSGRICFTVFLCVLMTGLIFLSAEQSHAQEADITVDLVLEPQLTKAQVLSLANLGIDNQGGGAPLFNLIIRNNDNVQQDNLYLDVEIRSNKVGTIVDLYQEQGRPFSLDPMQIVSGNNNQLQDGLPGVEERILFDGGLTNDGEDFVNSLEGSIKLPADIYTVVISIFQGNNSINGGSFITSVERTLGENLSSETNVDLYLLQPGAEIGVEESINSTLPVFRWDGPGGLAYRLVVVEDNGQSPEALIQAAISSEPTINEAGGGAGSLLEFEIVDAVINNLTFSIPPSGVQTLEPGKRYYWQVFTNRETVNGVESIPSEIWEFTIADQENELAQVSEEVQRSLRALLGSERYDRLRQDGFKFISITLDGQTLRGGAALQKLDELSGKLQDGDISIVIK